MAFLPVGILLGFAICVALGILFLTTILGPRNPLKSKLSPYECGAKPEGDARQPFKSSFYVVAVLFLLFDVEAAFFLPWALVYKDSLADGGALLIAMLLYLLFFVVALYFVLKKKILRLV